MIEIDYGKEAYVKLQQIDKELKKLEKEQEKYVYNELKFFLGGASQVTSLEKTFNVEAFKEGKHYFHFNMRADVVDLLGIVVNVYVNDVISYNFVCSLDIDYPFSVEPSLVKGLNTIKITMTALSPFTIDYLNATINGFVDYSKGDYRLSMVSNGGIDYVSLLTSNSLEVYSIDSVGKMSHLKTLYDVKDGSIVYVNASYLFIATVNLNDTLSVRRMNLSNNFVETTSLDVGGVTSVAGFKSLASGIKILFCKLYNLYELDVNSVTNYYKSPINTGKKAVKVYADANVKDCFVIQDRNNKCSFFSDRAVVSNVSTGDKFHIYTNDNGYSVEFTDGSKVLSQEISGLKTTESQTACYCDERLKLSSGKYLIRKRDVIYVE